LNSSVPCLDNPPIARPSFPVQASEVSLGGREVLADSAFPPFFFVRIVRAVSMPAAIISMQRVFHSPPIFSMPEDRSVLSNLWSSRLPPISLCYLRPHCEVELLKICKASFFLKELQPPERPRKPQEEDLERQSFGPFFRAATLTPWRTRTI